MRAPRDQGLFFATFVGLCLLVTLAFWLSIPVHQVVELEGEEEEAEESEALTLPPAVTPEERLKKMEVALGLARAVISQLEESQTGESKK
jgi:hypothetical protein